jgi:hypothetical protein
MESCKLNEKKLPLLGVDLEEVTEDTKTFVPVEQSDGRCFEPHEEETPSPRTIVEFDVTNP